MHWLLRSIASWLLTFAITFAVMAAVFVAGSGSQGFLSAAGLLLLGFPVGLVGWIIALVIGNRVLLNRPPRDRLLINVASAILVSHLNFVAIVIYVYVAQVEFGGFNQIFAGVCGVLMVLGATISELVVQTRTAQDRRLSDRDELSRPAMELLLIALGVVVVNVIVNAVQVGPANLFYDLGGLPAGTGTLPKSFALVVIAHLIFWVATAVVILGRPQWSAKRSLAALTIGAIGAAAVNMIPTLLAGLPLYGIASSVTFLVGAVVVSAIVLVASRRTAPRERGDGDGDEYLTPY